MSSYQEEVSPFAALVDEAFANQDEIRRLDFILLAERFGLDEGLQELVLLLPPGTYTKTRLVLQLNSILAGHARRGCRRSVL